MLKELFNFFDLFSGLFVKIIYPDLRNVNGGAGNMLTIISFELLL